MSGDLLSVCGLGFFAAGRHLFDDLSFSVFAGHATFVSGANGSGKTTLLRILSGLLLPDFGDVMWRGKPIKEQGEEYRADFMYVGHKNAVHKDLSPLENLHTDFALQNRRPRYTLCETLALAGLDKEQNRPCRDLSVGQNRRVALSRLVAFDFSLWLLDEPLAGLDDDGRNFFVGCLKAHLQKGGAAVIGAPREEALPDVSAAVVRLGAAA